MLLMNLGLEQKIQLYFDIDETRIYYYFMIFIFYTFLQI